jgi:hypothetical protein
VGKDSSFSWKLRISRWNLSIHYFPQLSGCCAHFLTAPSPAYQPEMSPAPNPRQCLTHSELFQADPLLGERLFKGAFPLYLAFRNFLASQAHTVAGHPDPSCVECFMLMMVAFKLDTFMVSVCTTAVTISALHCKSDVQPFLEGRQACSLSVR